MRSLFLFFLLTLLTPLAFSQSTYYVATSGANAGNDGSAARPWATIAHAVAAIPDDGSTIVVRNGVYTGRIRVTRRFTKKAFIRAERPYRAKLVASGEPVMTIYSAANMEISGFEFTRPPNAPGILIIQIQNTFSTAPAENIVLRDNIIHDSYNNDLLKINNGARNILVEGNIFYNQSGSDEHMDINGVTDVIVRDNIFFNDFGGSGRTNTNSTSSYIVIKNSAGLPENKRIQVRRNVFLNWQGSLGFGFISVGEDGKSYHEADDVMIENNLMLGNATNTMRAPFNLKGAKNVTFRNNTVSGAFPANAFAARLTIYGSNPPNENIRFYNNIWSAPGGTMTDFSDGEPWATVGAVMSTNLYWNAGKPIPVDGEVLNYTMDARAVLTDPKLGVPQNIVLPRWSGSAFVSGNQSVRQEFERLVKAYGYPGAGSGAIDAADAANAPVDDILGAARGAQRDIGAVEETGAVVALSGLTLTPDTIQGGSVATGTLTLSSPAKTGGFAVTLTSSRPDILATPVNVMVPEGAVSTTFQARTYVPGAKTAASVTATAAGVTKMAGVDVIPPSGLSDIRLGKSVVTGGTQISVTVTLQSPAPGGGSTVSLTSSNPTAVPVPASLVVPEGAISARVIFTGAAVSVDTPVSLSATLNGSTASSAMTAIPAALKSAAFYGPTIVSGGRVSVTISLTGPAPAGGLVVALRSSNAALIAPATVTIPAGATSVYPRIPTGSVLVDTPATLTVTLNGVSLTPTVTVVPAT